MKTKMILLCLTLCLWLNTGVAGAATLYGTRAGDHNDFTRIVFEFRDFVQFIQPVIKRDGTLSVVFRDTTTELPGQLAYKETNRVEGIQLYRRNSNLAANIALSIPDFKVKSYFLTNPERFVIDIYWMQRAPVVEVPQPKIAVLEKTEQVEQKEVEIEKTDKDERFEPFVNKIRGIVKGSAIQPIEKASIFSSNYSFLQTFFLAGLNLFTLVIIVLLCLILSRQIRVIDFAHLEYVPEPRKTPEDPMTTIDKKIKRVLGGMARLEEWR